MAAAENFYGNLNASELSAILLLKGSSMSTDRDAGFCSGSSEGGDDLSTDHSRMEPRSPTDASEDSVEVKVTPITFPRNKRKSTEPSRVVCEQESLGPLKKRIRYTSAENCLTENDPKTDHFRPWDQRDILHNMMLNPAEVLARHPGVTTLHRAPVDIEDIQDQPLALVAKKQSSSSPSPSPLHITSEKDTESRSSSRIFHTSVKSNHPYHPHPNLNLTHTNDLDLSHTRSSDPIIPLTVQNSSHSRSSDTIIPLTVHSSSNSHTRSSDPNIPLTVHSSSSSTSSSISSPVITTVPVATSISSSSNSSTCGSQRPQQRNYKNMTRERRIEANARERTRVHTISAAYDTLRRSIPSYAHTQKLSKLSVLRVACSYILSLSRMAGYDYSEDQSEPSIAECFEMVTKTIQTEGKIRKKKDE